MLITGFLINVGSEKTIFEMLACVLQAHFYIMYSIKKIILETNK